MGKSYSKSTREKRNNSYFNPQSGKGQILSEREWKGCARKNKSYDSERVANEAAAKLSEELGTKWRAYRCEFCQKSWHLTVEKKRD